jgi:hypothetical protein
MLIRKKSTIYFFSLVFLVLTACSHQLGTRYFKYKPYELADSVICNKARFVQPCITVYIAYFKVTFTLDEQTRNVINQDILEFICAPFGSHEGDVNKIVKEFLTKYKKEFTENDPPWEYKIDVSIKYLDKRFVTIAKEETNYTGGAHSNSQSVLRSYSLQSGHALTIDDILTDPEALRNIAEKIFRKKHNIAPDVRLSEAGFNFENDTFSLAGNFGIVGKKLIFYYNPYEIAPYAFGPEELVVPTEDIRDIIKAGFQ